MGFASTVRLFVVVTCSMAFATAALAATINSEAEIDIAGAIQSDVDGPQVGGVVLSSEVDDYEPTCDLTSKAYVDASMSNGGVSAARADGAYLENAPLDEMALYGQATWTETVLNDTAFPAEYEFLYNLLPSHVQVCDPVGISTTTGAGPVPNGDFPRAGFRIRAFKDDVEFLQILIELTGGTAGHNLQEVGPSVGPSDVSSGTVVRYDIAGIDDAENLGVLLPGASMKVVYQIEVWVETPGYSLGGQVFIGDPLDLGIGPGFNASVAFAEEPVATENSSWGSVKSLFD